MSYRTSIIKTTQRGTITLTNATSATATITAVVLANSSIRLLGVGIESAAAGDNTKNRLRLELTNATTVTVFAFAADAVVNYTVSYEVTEYFARVVKSVQRGTIVITTGTTSNTATVTSVNTAKAALSCLGQTSDTNLGSNGYVITDVVLTNATTITANVGFAAGTGQTVGYELLEYF
jgi:hypothetical protein